jgi:putative membrane protein insertion efficiency factor
VAEQRRFAARRKNSFSSDAGRIRHDEQSSIVSRIKLTTFSALRRAPRRFGRLLVGIYRLTFSPLVGFHCRHLPTCSQYSDEALERFGLWAGGWMTLARLLRCQPWGTSGLDYVPTALPAGARWYLPWRYARWRGVNETPPRPEVGQHHALPD